MAKKTSKTKAASRRRSTAKTADTSRAPHEGSEPGAATNPGSTTGTSPQATRARAVAASRTNRSAAKYATTAGKEMKTADQRIADAHKDAVETATANNRTTPAKQAAAQKDADQRARQASGREPGGLFHSPLSADLPQEQAIPNELALKAALREGKMNDLSVTLTPSDINPPHTTDMVAAIGTGPFGDSGPSGAGEAGIGLPARRGSATQ